MAQSIVRLKVESSEYDNKLRRASQMLVTLGENAKRAGGSFTDADKSAVDFARSVGQMETRATQLKGKIGELTQAYTNLSAQYKQMTTEEKQSPYGQALSQSLEQLRERIQDGKKSLEEINQSLQETSNTGKSTGNVLESLAGKVGINITQLGAMGTALGAATTAAKIAKDAFFSNESQVDSWGRTVASAQSIYNAFVNSLNNSDFNGFFNRIDGIIQKAEAAYNAIDRLNTVMTIINPERAKLQARQQQLRETIRREGANSEAGRQAQQELLALEPKLKRSYKTEAGLNWDAFDKAVKQRLAEGGIKLDEKSYKFLMNSLHSEEGFRQLERGAKGTRQYVPGTSVTTSWGQSMDTGHWVDTRNTNQKLLDLFTDEWRQQYSPYLTASFNALGASSSVGLQNTRYVAAGKGGGGGGGTRSGRGGGGGGGNTTTVIPLTEEQANSKAIEDLTQEYITASDERREAIRAEIKTLQDRNKEIQGLKDAALGKIKDVIPEGTSRDTKGDRASLADLINAEIASAKEKVDVTAMHDLLKFSIEQGLGDLGVDWAALQEQMAEGMDISDEQWQEIVAKINEQLAEGIEPIELDVSTGNIKKVEKVADGVKEGWQDAARAVQAVGSALQQIENPAARIAGIIGEAIANIALGFAKATAKDSRLGVFGWIAAVAGGLGTMISTIAAIKSATAGSYAEGGIIPGTHYSGDMQFASVNSGELILNRAQQNNLANQLAGGQLGNIQLTATISGEDIVLAVNNAGRRRGRGEYVTTNSR